MEEGKNKATHKMRNDSMCSFCDSSHWIADSAVGPNQRLRSQNKRCCHTHTKIILPHQCFTTAVNKKEEKEGKETKPKSCLGKGRAECFFSGAVGQLSIIQEEGEVGMTVRN